MLSACQFQCQLRLFWCPIWEVSNYQPWLPALHIFKQLLLVCRGAHQERHHEAEWPELTQLPKTQERLSTKARDNVTRFIDLSLFGANCPNLLRPSHLLVPTFETGLVLLLEVPNCQNCRQRLRPIRIMKMSSPVRSKRRPLELTLLGADPIVASAGTSAASAPDGNAPIFGLSLAPTQQISNQ